MHTAKDPYGDGSKIIISYSQEAEQTTAEMQTADQIVLISQVYP